MDEQKDSIKRIRELHIILHMGDCYPGDGPNAKRMRTLYEVLTECGHKVEILAPTTREKDILPEGLCPCPALPLKSKSTVNRILNGLSFGVMSVLTALKLRKVDIVLTSCPPALINPFGWMIARLKGARLVYDVRDIWPDVAWEMGSFSKHSVYSQIFAFIRDFMLKHADLITAVSDGKVRKLQAYHPHGEVIKIANGFDIHFLENKEDLEVVKRFHLADKFSCVYVGNLGLAQGLEQLLYVAGRAKEEKMEVQFLLFGDGVEAAQLKRYSEEYKLDNVYFPGRLPGEKIFTVLRHASMSFIPLVNDQMRDSIPTKMYEAIGVGCPILLAAVGDAAEILKESGLGIAVRPNDREALWDGFCRMYRSMKFFTDNRAKAQTLMHTKHSLRHSAEQLETELYMRYGDGRK